MAIPTTLPTGDRTLINTVSQIKFCNSPIHLRLQNAAEDTSITSVAVYLWIWNGAENKALGKPNFVLTKNKISKFDNYISLQIQDQIKSYLENPLNAPNTYQPTYSFNEVAPPAITGLGVFYQVVADITSTAGTIRNNYPTNFTTLGYRWNYEQNAATGNNGITANGSLGFLGTVNKWYNPKIHNYFSQSFNLANPIAVATSANMITTAIITPPAAFSRCATDPSLLIFLNKLGLWETFTPHGKFTASSSITSETTNRAFRDPSTVDNSYSHSKQRGALDVLQSYMINTGSLTEDMVETVEQIIYSSKVYLIRFKGDIQTSAFLGVTVDSTLISVDSLNITVDSDTVGADDLGFFKTFQQIPVTIKDSDFLRKSRVNDKNKIDYNIMLEETNNKINNIR